MEADQTDPSGEGPRHGLRGWFGKLRRRRWVLLFVFEFFVVLLGVLAAQALQSWFESRREVRVAAASKATLDRNLRSIALSAELRRRGLPCYANRLGKIAQAISTRSQTSVPLTAPEEALVIDLGWSGETPALIAEHHGSELADKYVNIALWVDAFRRAQNREQESWSDLLRLSPRLGQITEADRSAAKGALIDARRDLQHVSWAAGHLSRHARDLRIDPDLSELAGLRASTDSCERASSYSIEEHERAQKAGRLVTGEKLAER